MSDIDEAIRKELLSWPGVTAVPHRFGGVEFRFGGRELGHLHADRLADLPFPVRIREELVASGRASPHHVLPRSGWVSRYIAGPDDLPAVIGLFRMQYERHRERFGPAAGEPPNDVHDSDRQAG
jgi:hypothetical protein